MAEIDELFSRLESFRKLGENWDGYGAEPVSDEIIEKAKKALVYMNKRGIELPGFIAPFSDGVNFEYYHEGKLYGTEIEISSEDSLAVLTRNESFEGSLEKVCDRLLEL